MANRNTLAVSYLDDFREWLVSQRWNIEGTRGFYEVLRARKDGRSRPLIVWKRDSNRRGAETTHLSIDDRDYGIIADYLAERKRRNEKTDNPQL